MLSCFSPVRLFPTPWTVVCQASLSVGFFRHEYWSELPCLAPGNLPSLGMESAPLIFPALAGELFTTEPPGSPSYPFSSDNKPPGLIITSTRGHFYTIEHWSGPQPALHDTSKEQIKEIKISFSSLQRLAFKPFILLLTLKYYFKSQKLNIAFLFFIVFLLKPH